jgi:CBS domain containing-hemolysin-like protein
LDIEPPLGLLQASISTAATALAVVGAAFAVLDALLKTAAIIGIGRRELSRQQGWRTVAGAVSAKLLATALFYIPLQELLGPALGYLAGPFSGLLRSVAVLGAALLTAVLVASVFAVMFILLDRASRPASKIVPVGEKVGQFFGFWAGRGKREKAGEEEPDFEITMASGEAVEDEEREYIENILELGETTVREVMKPRPDVLALDADWAPERILSEVAASRYSRFPVYEQTIDNIAGILHIRDLFEFLARSDGLTGFDLHNLIKDAHFIPESKKVDDALREMQRGKWQMAIVLDEYGGTAGIVTVEDILEEIVGEIQDEYDEEAKQIHEREDGSYILTATLSIDDLNELFDTEIESEDVDTLGGYIVNTLGKIPSPQDSFDEHGLRFTVLSVERKRIGRVRVERVAVEA